MKLFRSFLLFFSATASLAAADVAKLTPVEAAKLVADGKAVLVDVREPGEWLESGVAAPAALLPKREFDAGQAGDWKTFLAQLGDKQVILYCRSGKRAGVVAEALAAKGLKTANAGGFKDWVAAGLPVKPYAPGKK